MSKLLGGLSWTRWAAVLTESRRPNKEPIYVTGRDDDREEDRRPDELQEANNVTFHPAISLIQQLFNI